MVRIRLRRAGAKGQPTHRIVAADKESPRDGRFIEILGDYNPRTEPATIRVNEDRIYYWLGVGAQPSKAVLKVFNTIGLMERYQRFKDGEDLDTLLEEARQLQEERTQDPRTRRDEEVLKAVSKKKTAKEEPEAPEAAAEEEGQAEAEEEKAESAAEEAEQQAEQVETEEEQAAEEEAAEEQAEEEEEKVEEAEEEEEQQEQEEEEGEEQEEEQEEAAPAAEAEEIRITDAARELAEKHNIDISEVEGTGKDGNILKSDIEALIED